MGCDKRVLTLVPTPLIVEEGLCTTLIEFFPGIYKTITFIKKNWVITTEYPNVPLIPA